MSAAPFIATIGKDFTFQAAHKLTNVPDGHPCGRVHGHGYRVRIELKGPVHHETGWLCDFADIGYAWNVIGKKLDHWCLNDVPMVGAMTPTAENLAALIFVMLEKPFDAEPLPHLHAVTVWETEKCFARVEAQENL